MGNQIHWYPGHMNKALHKMEDRIKSIDVVVEVLDARIPLSSLNDEFEKFTMSKKKLFIYNKIDLADPVETDKWKQYFEHEDKNFLFVDMAKSDVSILVNKQLSLLAKSKHEKEISRGMKPQPIKVMIIGIPNVGKSTLINKLAKRKAAGVENRPGFTRGEQFIRVNNDYLLVDTPGILPASYENKDKASNLALIGAIKEDILPSSELVDILLKKLAKLYPNALKSRFDIGEIGSTVDVLNTIAKKRGLLISGGEYDIEKAETLLLKEYKEGKLGRFTLEKCN